MKKVLSLLSLLLFMNTVVFADSCTDFLDSLSNYNVLMIKLRTENSDYIAAKDKFKKYLSVNSSLAIKQDDYKYASLLHTSLQKHIKILKASALIVGDAYTDLDIMELQALNVEPYCKAQAEEITDAHLDRVTKSSIILLVDIENLVGESEKVMKLLRSYLKL